MALLLLGCLLLRVLALGVSRGATRSGLRVGLATSGVEHETGTTRAALERDLLVVLREAARELALGVDGANTGLLVGDHDWVGWGLVGVVRRKVQKIQKDKERF